MFFFLRRIQENLKQIQPEAKSLNKRNKFHLLGNDFRKLKSKIIVQYILGNYRRRGK